MAEDSIPSLVKPRKNASNGGKSGMHSDEKNKYVISSSSASCYPRASVGTYNDGDSSERSSSGNANSPNNSQEAVPHYLRASTGSCHDFCKYGRKQTFEEKPWRRSLTRITKPPSGKLILGESPVPLGRKNVKAVVIKPSSLHDTEPQVKELNPSPDTQSVGSDSPAQVKEVHPTPDSRSIASDLAPDAKSIASDPPSEMKAVNPSTDTESTASNPPALVKELNPSPDTKSIASDPPEVIKIEVSLSSKVSVSPKEELAIGKKIPETGRKSNNLSVRGSLPAQRKPLVAKSSPSLSTSASKLGSGRKNSNIKNGKFVVASKTSMSVPRASDASSSKASISETLNLKSSKNRKLQAVSHLKDQNRTRKSTLLKPKNEKIPERTLRVVKTSSCIEDRVVEGKDGPGEEGDTKGLNGKNVPTGKGKKIVEGSRKTTLKKGIAVVFKDKESSSLKLTFRRGKVVDFQSENNSPRKLQFGRGRLSVGSHDVKADLRRSLKKKAVVDDKVGTSPSTRKVVLRHREVQKKKEVQVLLNNVIEETASKLVQSRKSKVKALVGAFETVISIQQRRKPTAQAVN